MKQNDMNKLLRGMKVPARKSTEEAWNELQLKIEGKTPVRSLVSEPWLRWVAAAVIVGFGLFWITSSKDAQTFVAEENEHIALPDGSEVDLRKGSTLSWDETGWNAHRTISLDGEAYFEVEKGSKFKVKANQGTIEVLGTRFNVFTTDDALRVDCYSGKVKVATPNQQRLLTQGMATKLKEKTLAMPFTIESNEPLWVSGEFGYERADLNQVFFDLEQQFGVQCDLPELEGMEFTGAFSANSLEEALQIVCLPMGLTFEVSETGQIKIRKLIK